jgi:hypothetical protein
MRRTVVVASMVAASVSCAGTPVFHDGPTGLNGRESRALLAAARGRPGGFERFWLRPGCRPGLIKWAGDRSHAVAQAPPALLGLIRDEIGRVNRLSRDGETAFLTITVFEWTRRMFGRPPRVGYEVVGRDRLVVPRERALDLAETDELLVAREIGRKLGAELGR